MGPGKEDRREDRNGDLRKGAEWRSDWKSGARAWRTVGPLQAQSNFITIWQDQIDQNCCYLHIIYIPYNSPFKSVSSSMIQGCRNITTNSRTFSSPWKEISYLSAARHSPPLPYPSLHLITTDLLILDVSCKWNNAVLSMTFSGFMGIVARISTSFLFRARWHSVVQKSHILCIPQLMDTWVVSTLAIMNDTIMNICTSVNDNVLLVLTSILLGHTDNSVFNLLKDC